MPSFTHKVTHIKNAHMAEGPLRNTHFELRTARHVYKDLIAQRTKAIRELNRWVQNMDDESLQHLLRGVGELEVRSIEHERKYSLAYKQFVEVFKTILAERQELNVLRDKLRQATKEATDSKRKSEKLQRRLTMATKDGSDLERTKSRAALADAAYSSRKSKLSAMDEAYKNKLVEFQRSLHTHIRSAFKDISAASMALLQERAIVEEEILKLLAMFPNVKDVKNGEFVYESFPDMVAADPIWHKGERFAQLLEFERMNAADSLDKEGQQYNSLMCRLKAEASARENALVDELEKTKEYAFSLERDLQSMRQSQVTTSLLQTQIGVEDATKITEEGFSHYILRHVTMSEHALDALVAEMENELNEENDFVSKASALSMTLNSMLISAAGYAKYSKAENSLELMPLVRQVAAASADLISLAVTRAPSISNFKFQSPNFSTLQEAITEIHHDYEDIPEMDEKPIPVQTDSKKTSKKDKKKQSKKKPQLEPDADSGNDTLHGFFPSPRGASGMYLPPSTPQDTERRSSFIDAPGERLRCDSDLFGFDNEHHQPKKAWEQAHQESHTDEHYGWESMPPPPSVSVPYEDLVQSAGSLKSLLQQLSALVQALAKRDEELQGVDMAAASALDKNVKSATQILDDGLSRLAQLKAESAQSDTGRLLETNQAMLDQSMTLLNRLVQVIKGARQMQLDLQAGADGKKLSTEEFTHRHKVWVEGFGHIATETLEASPLLVEALGEVVKCRGKHEEMQVSIRSISARSAQLIASSKTKQLSKGCTSKENIITGGNDLINISHTLLAAVRESYNLSLASILIEDYTDLSQNQAKRLMMAKQVEVLRLESTLEKEREKLSRLRTMMQMDS